MLPTTTDQHDAVINVLTDLNSTVNQFSPQLAQAAVRGRTTAFRRNCFPNTSRGFVAAQVFVARLNTSLPLLSADLKSLSLPLNATVEIVSDMTDTVTGLAPVVNNVTILTNASSLPSPTMLNDTTGISSPNPSNATLVTLLSGRLDNSEVRDVCSVKDVAVLILLAQVNADRQALFDKLQSISDTFAALPSVNDTVTALLRIQVRCVCFV